MCPTHLALASGVPLYLQTLMKFNIGAFLGSYWSSASLCKCEIKFR